MICNKCGTELSDGAKFCPECGEKVDLTEPGKCPSCGAQNAEGAKFCRECGAALNSETETNLEPGQISAAAPPQPDAADKIVSGVSVIWNIIKAAVLLFFAAAFIFAIPYFLDPYHDDIGNKESRLYYATAGDVMEDLIAEKFGDCEIKFMKYSPRSVIRESKNAVIDGEEYHMATVDSYVTVNGVNWHYQIVIGLHDEDYLGANDWYIPSFAGLKEKLGIRVKSDVEECYYRLITFE